VVVQLDVLNVIELVLVGLLVVEIELLDLDLFDLSLSLTSGVLGLGATGARRTGSLGRVPGIELGLDLLEVRGVELVATALADGLNRRSLGAEELPQVLCVGAQAGGNLLG